MDENLETMETAEQTSEAAFEAGWNDESDVTFETDQSQDDAPAPETDPAPQDAPENPQQDAPAGAADPQPPAETPKDPPLRRFGETVDPTPEERVVLQQKGLDYDRVKGRLDEVKPFVDIFHQCAMAEGMSDADFATSLRTRMHMGRGLSETEARLEVQREDAAAQQAAQESRLQAFRAAEKRRKDDLTLFNKKFPAIAADPQSIPQEVWDAVNNEGQTLTFAYQGYALDKANARIAELEQQLAASKQNRSNADRSTGSMGTDGADTTNGDAFMAGWNEE